MSNSNRLNDKKRLEFFIFLEIVCFAFGAYFLYRQNILISTLIAVFAIVWSMLFFLRSKLIDITYQGWIGLGNQMGKIISPLMLAFIYFILITPIGLFMRVFKLKLFQIHEQDSAWVKRNKNSQSNLNKLY